MRLTVLQENFYRAINTSLRFVSTRAQLPILSNILLVAKGNKLHIQATNLEISISTTIGAKVEEEGDLAIPAKTINDLVTNFKPGPVVLFSEKEQLKLTSGRFESLILGMNSNDFPKVPQKLNPNKVVFSKEDLSEALSKTLFAISGDETRPILTGVFLSQEKGFFEFVATDGFRLSQKVLRLNSLRKGRTLVFPKSVLVEVLRLVQDGGQIGFAVDEAENQVVFDVSEYIISSRLLEGKYPDYQKIIPKQSNTTVFVDKEELLQAVKLAAVFARDSANIVKFNIKKSGMEIISESQYAGSQKSEVEAKIEGEELMISFNCRFVEEAVQCIKSESIEIRFQSPNLPGVFTGSGEKDFLHLIMPVKTT